uniref:Uncharacterized protein n=1 Tax=Setaria viridis TaxID=4556 RepID=A0A4U6VC79_SETVI|nr:hypothetical protein SEVIR_3G175750v2 [Setaria viridis]
MVTLPFLLFVSLPFCDGGQYIPICLIMCDVIM